MEDAPIEILIFEDDPAQARLISGMLAESRKPEFSVQLVGTLADGLGLLRSRDFDVILVDLSLPDSQGLETALAVRNLAMETPVIAITGFEDEDAALQALRADIRDYLVKGEITASLLKRSIRYAIQRQRDIETQRQSEQRFASFMHHLGVAAWMKDLRGRYVQANAEHERIFAMPFHQYAGKTDAEFLSPEIARRLRENDARVTATGESLQTTETLRLTDGREHHFVVSKFPISGPDGRAAFVGGIALDITDRVRTEEALRLSEARFRALHDENPAMIFTLDAEGMIISINSACLHLGYQADELIGQSVLKIFHEDDRPSIAEQLQMCRQHPDQVHRWQARKISKSGGVLWVEEVARVVYDLNHDLNVLVACQDITDRKRAEESVQKSEKKFTAVFQVAPALLSISSLKDGKFVDVNDTMLRVLGYRREEMVGRTPVELNLWEDPADRAAILETLATQGSVKNVEVRLRGKGGDSIIGLFSAEYIDFSGDRFVLSLVKDITLKRRAQEQVERLNTQLASRTVELEDANRELEAFNFTVAHDLRNPLNIINGYCQIVIRACGVKMDEECRGYHQQISDAVVRMGKLISALLDFSRIAHAELHRERFDISAVAQSVAAELRLGEPGRAVDFRISEGILVDGDRELLQVVLNNLLGNAWKYTAMRDQALIEFGVTEVDGQAACFVRDNGPGFDAANASKLFIPFQRLAETSEMKGFGIGLATVERIIRRHGGRIWAEGIPGKGATFYFTWGAR